MMSKKRKSRENKVSIKWKLLIYLTIFMLFMLFTVWAFQIRMLVPFYEAVKFKELESVSNTVENAILKSDEINPLISDCAYEYATCISVYRIDGRYASEVAKAEAFAGCVIHNLSKDDFNILFNELYTSALSNDGVYYERRMIDPVNGEKVLNQKIFPFPNITEVPKTTSNVVYLKLLDVGEEHFVIFLNSELTPLSTTVKTLELQFWMIVSILLVETVIFALALYKKISKPIVNMNKAAKSLAKGKYDEKFEGSGYKETNELADLLNYASDELSKTDKFQKELISNISHDLRTPLTMIKGYGEVMRDIPGENTPENVQVIIDEATRLSELVNDLLDISSIQAGTRKPEAETFNLTSVVRETLSRYEKLTMHNGYKIDFVADGDVFVNADRGMILQVIYNLINNAVNYCGEDKYVLVTQALSEGDVRISVTDHGEGIPEDQIKDIWNRYYKVDRIHRMSKIGTGLGLSIVREILDLHKAQYGVESKVGEGSTFWFTLSLTDKTIDNSLSENIHNV